MPPVNLIGPDGRVVSVDESEAAAYHTLGYTPETVEQEAGRVIETELERAYGDSTIAAGALGLARGATLGLSDVALRGAGVSDEFLRETQARNVAASTIGEIGGAVAPALLTGGASGAARVLGSTPAGQVARLERAITGLGAEAGLATKVGYAAAGGAAEGALAGAGSFISDVALEKKELSAEAFVGAMGKGALFGGVLGGGLAGAERGMVAARKLFPSHEVTEEAVTVAEQSFKQAADDSFRATDELKQAARAKLDEERAKAMALRTAEREQRLATRTALDEQKLAQEQAKTAQAQARAEAAQAQAEAAKARAERAKAGPQPRKKPEKAKLPEGFDHGPLNPKKTTINKGVPAFDDVDPDAVYVFKASEIADRIVDPLGGSGRQLGRTLSIEKGWQEGKTFAPLQGTVRKDGTIEWTDGRHRFEAAVRGDREIAVRLDRSTVDAADDAAAALDDAAIQSNPEAAKIADAVREVERTEIGVKDWLAKYHRPRGVRYVDSLTGRATRGTWPRSTDKLVTYSDTPVDEILGEPISLRGAERLDDLGLMRREKRLAARQAEEELMRAKSRPPEAVDIAGIFRRAEEEGRLISRDTARAGVAEVDEIAGPYRPGDEGQIISRETAKTGASEADEILDMANEQDIGRFVEDAQAALKVIGDYERAQAQLADVLGPAAPPKAQEVAAAYAQKVDQQAERVAERMATAADDAVKRAYDTIMLPAAKAQKRATGLGALGEKAGEGLAALEVLQTIGVPGIPDVDKLPVIGPLLGGYAKFMAARGIYKRFGGKVPKSTEAKIAEKAAGVRDKAVQAVDRLLDVGGKAAARGGAVLTAGAVAALESPLFDSGEPKRTRRAPAKPASKPAENFKARSEELMLVATNPEAAREAIRKRVPTTNPEVGKAVEDAVMRKLEFLAGKMPKDPLPPNPLRKREWTPDRVALEKFARYVKAAEDPLSVLEDLERGTVTPEAAETIKAVYPRLFGEIQERLIDRLYELQAELPFQRRVQISLLFDVAVDDSMKPDAIAFYQQGHVPTQTEVDALQPGAPPQPPTPALAANVTLSQSYQTGMDRRAVR